jgi:hypothetical protein
LRQPRSCRKVMLGQMVSAFSRETVPTRTEKAHQDN